LGVGPGDHQKCNSLLEDVAYLVTKAAHSSSDGLLSNLESPSLALPHSVNGRGFWDGGDVFFIRLTDLTGLSRARRRNIGCHIVCRKIVNHLTRHVKWYGRWNSGERRWS
jgi:hypothetical protein